MKYLFAIALFVLMSCNNGNNDANTGETLPDPQNVQPPSDAVPEDMIIVNDSVVKPDSAAMERTQDSIQDTMNEP